MILSADIRHKNQIIRLWSEAFGDSPNTIDKYLETLLKYFVVYEDDGIVKGMLSVLPVTSGNKNGGYIYAVVTHPDYRGQGICRALIESVKQNKKYDFLVLVPQDESLFEFYAKMDFIKVSLLVKKELCVNKINRTKLNLKKLAVKKYETLRNLFFGEENLIKWDTEMLFFAKTMYGGEFYEIKNEEKRVGLAFLYKEKETVFIKELITENPEETANFLGSELDAQTVKFSYIQNNGEPTYMMFPDEFSGLYFGIYFD